MLQFFSSEILGNIIIFKKSIDAINNLPEGGYRMYNACLQVFNVDS